MAEKGGTNKQNNGKSKYIYDFIKIIKTNIKYLIPLYVTFFLNLSIFLYIMIINDEYFEYHRNELMINLLLPFLLISFIILIIINKFSIIMFKKKKKIILIRSNISTGMFILIPITMIPYALVHSYNNPESLNVPFIYFLLLIIFTLFFLFFLMIELYSPKKVEISNQKIKYRSTRFKMEGKSYSILISDIKNIFINNRIGKEGIGIIIITKKGNNKYRLDFGKQYNVLLYNYIQKFRN
jgi:hypothetical protein